MSNDRQRELERNLLAIILAGDESTAARLVVEVRPDDLTEPHAQWLLAEVGKRIGRGHKLYDLLPYADDAQAEYLQDLHRRYVTSATATDLMAELKQRSLLRGASAVLEQGLARVRKGEVAAVNDTFTKLAGVVAPATVRKVHDAKTILSAAKQRMELMRAGKVDAYLPLGMPVMAKQLALQPGQLVLLGARTGVGKTALAMCWTWVLAFDKRIPVLYLNSEMSEDEMGLRLMAIGRRADLRVLRTAPEPEHIALASEMLRDYANAPALTSEAIGELTSAEVVALTRYHHANKGVQVLIVDYIQRLADARNQKERQEWQVLMDITRTLKTLATDLGIVVIALAQLNSTGELQASKGMANDCDVVLAMEETVDPDDPDPERRGPKREVQGQTHLVWTMKGRHIPNDLKFPLARDPISLRFWEVW